jgi:hypothetical protein
MTKKSRVTESAWLQISMKTKDLPKQDVFGPEDIKNLPFGSAVLGVAIYITRTLGPPGEFHPSPRVRF